MDIKHLRYASALAQELNFARAAEKLHLSQPALSRAIQTLEAQLGFLLFDRDKRSVAVTRAGDAFLREARSVLFQMRTLELNMGHLRDGRVGHVAFGAGPSPTNSLLGETLFALRDEHPGITLRVDSNNWRYLLQHLRAEEIEFFIADSRGIRDPEDLAVTPLCRQFCGFFCRLGHPLLALGECLPVHLIEYGLVVGSMPIIVQENLKQLFNLNSNQLLPVLLESDSLTLLKSHIRGSNLILLAPRAALVDELCTGVIQELRVDGSRSLFTDIDIVQLRGRTLSPSAKIVIDTLRDTASRLCA